MSVKTFLRFWISFVTVICFMFGWALVAKTSPFETPVTPQAAAAGETLTIAMPRIPDLDELIGDTSASVESVQTFSVNVIQSVSRPGLRTGGS